MTDLIEFKERAQLALGEVMRDHYAHLVLREASDEPKKKLAIFHAVLRSCFRSWPKTTSLAAGGPAAGGPAAGPKPSDLERQVLADIKRIGGPVVDLLLPPQVVKELTSPRRQPSDEVSTGTHGPSA